MARTPTKPRATPVEDSADPATELASAEAELAGLPPQIEEAVTEGREVDYSHLTARKSILERRVTQLRTGAKTDGLAALKASAQELSERWIRLDAQRRTITAEALARIAEAEKRANDAALDLAGATSKIERMENYKSPRWWTIQGLMPPGRPPVADRVKATTGLSRAGMGLRIDYGKGSGLGGLKR